MPPVRLDSWKEIAAYFDRDVRTVQLWEKKEGLPVHRHEHSTRSSVYAFPPELDRWRSARQAERQAPQQVTQLVAAPLIPPATTPRRIVPTLALTGGAILLTALTIVALRLHRHQPQPAFSAPPAAAATPMLAVLPFDDLSGPHSPELWVDGLTDDLITELGRSPGIQVISRRSVMQFRGTQQSLPAIASQLHASLVLEGTILHRNGEAHINARLVDPLHDRQIWSATYTRDTRDILTLQDELASNIATAVATQITGQPSQPAIAAHTVDPQVRINYLTGLYLFNRRDETDMLTAVDAFQAAIAKDPHYAPAYAGLADCYNLLAVWGRLSSAEAFPRSRAAALTALRLDPSSAEAYTSLALETFRYEWNFAEADRDFQKALQLNPNSAPAHHWYGQSLVDRRRFDEGIHELKLAQNLDPLSAIVASDVADASIYAGRNAEAIAELHRVLNLYPDFVPAHNYLVSAYTNSGDLASALREAEISLHLTGKDTEIRTLHLAQEVHDGHLEQARAEADALARNPAFGPIQRADLYFQVDELDKGYAAIEQARAQHDWWIITLPVDPSFSGIRKAPRFVQIEHEVGLPTA